MAWEEPVMSPDGGMAQRGHSYSRETEDLWVCRDCRASTRWRPGSPGPNFAVLRVGKVELSEARGDFSTCAEAQRASILSGPL